MAWEVSTLRHMLLTCTRRNKNGKTYHYWGVVANRRLTTGRMAQRQVLYLGELNDRQKAVKITAPRVSRVVVVARAAVETLENQSL